MSSTELDTRTKVTLLALKHESGPARIFHAFKAQLMAASVSGSASSLGFLSETAQVLPNVEIAARFIKTVGMMRDRVRTAAANASPEMAEFTENALAIIDQAELEARTGFRKEEIDLALLALLAVEVVES